jgi:prefoldin subunit 5
MDIEKQITVILSNQKQLEITNKRLRQKLQSFERRNEENLEKRLKDIEENIRNLGKRIGKIEKQIE